VPTPGPTPARSLASRAGFIASAFAVFLCGWFAMQTDDWKKMVLFSVLALGAVALTSLFSRQGR
jgi:cyanate permease